MGSSPLLSFLVLTSLMFLFVTLSHSSQYDVAQEPAPPVTSRKISRDSEKVTMSLYYESLCPYCSSFIVGPLAQVLETDLMTILNLRLVPWGNAILDSNNTIECQHGEDECYLNIIHTCAINLWPDLKKHFNFIKCIEKQYKARDRNGAEDSWEVCSGKLRLSTQSMKTCYDSGHGKKVWFIH
ncbi:gamma-interferon-responsive lysosomal thiol protein-like [Populus nigra]|uniref:gamma-interferon-responsive lysosomal thiol protein-like n=1 Tax=Populus nigra TaxID=3691 RepID=UPI002B27A91E|nr:gamma-interferon-responsive lysosomal thiol protein-like [Populus nigra]